MPQLLTDNDLLARYLSGDITARQEAELERRALTDVDLRAAMKGIQAAPEHNHTASLERMLRGVKERATEKPPVAPSVATVRSLPPPRRPLMKYWWGAAAGVALLVVAIFLLPKLLPHDAGLVAYEPESEQSFPMEIPPSASATEADVDGLVVEEVATPAPAPPPAAPVPTQSAPPPNPAPASSPNLSLEQETEEIASAEAATMAPEEEMVIEELASEPAELLVTPPAPAPVPRPSQANARRQRSETVAIPTVTGFVLDEFGRPVAGAIIRLPGLPTGIKTDSTGAFSLVATPASSQLIIEAEGFEAEEVTVANDQALLQITLNEIIPADNDPLGASSVVEFEVDGTGLTTRRPTAYATVSEGLRPLRKRIQAAAPPETAGETVRVSFLVYPGGRLADLEFKGTPSAAARSYVATALRETDGWRVEHTDDAVRVSLKFNL